LISIEYLFCGGRKKANADFFVPVFRAEIYFRYKANRLAIGSGKWRKGF